MRRTNLRTLCLRSFRFFFIVRLPDFLALVCRGYAVPRICLLLGFPCGLRAIDVMDVRRLFSRMVEALQFSGLLQGYGGSEEELVLHLSEIIPGFTETQARLLLRLFTEASFGGAPITEGQETEVRRMYRQIVRAAYQKLPFWKSRYSNMPRCFYRSLPGMNRPVIAV